MYTRGRQNHCLLLVSLVYFKNASYNRKRCHQAHGRTGAAATARCQDRVPDRRWETLTEHALHVWVFAGVVNLKACLLQREKEVPAVLSAADTK